ncbi:hypothetical protein NGM10_01135 [Halorussus salilacus]|uniref:DUF7552 domain-containing protein n=1 Tax=Halorussus salilacus TaxID=2953750 RepID=UPI00209FAAA3|nr:hypothetical protein [Halorussus salilacus]USZ68359.1 hypothetical protein NGM10_01135 [Halorussus salilacus]
MADALDRLRRRIDGLATPDGDFYVACAETDRRPAPLADRRFPTAAAACEAAAAAREYREALRESDPGLPEYRLAAYQARADAPTLVSTREPAAGRRENGLPRSSRSVTLSGDGEREWLRMDNAPLVHVSHDGEPLDDDAVARQLDAKL